MPQSDPNRGVPNLTKPVIGLSTQLQQIVDSSIKEQSWKYPAYVATTDDVDLSNPSTDSYDGEQVPVGFRILARAQSDGTENGLYNFWGVGIPMTRTDDADTAQKLIGAKVMVLKGGLYANTEWKQTSDDIALGVTAITWVEASLPSQPEATILGRAIGSGTGVPVPLTEAQQRELLWNSTNIVFDETGDLEATIDSVGANVKTIIVYQETSITTTPYTVPDNVTVEFIKGGKMANPTSAKTINWYGQIKADVYQNIFGEATQGNLTINLQPGSTMIASAGWFGAVDDLGLNGILEPSQPGTDSSPHINACIQAAQNRMPVWLPQGRYHASYILGYRVKDQVLLEILDADQNGNESDRLKSFKFLGGNLMDSQSRTLVYGDMDGGCIVNIQGARNGEIANLSVVGKNRAPYFLTKQLQPSSGTQQQISGTWSVSAGTGSFTGSGGAATTELEVGQSITPVNATGNNESLIIDTIADDDTFTTTTNHTATLAGVAVKKYRKDIENYVTDGIDIGVKTALTGIGVDYNDTTGLTTEYGTKNTKIRNCLVQNTYIAYGHDIGGNVQGDTTTYENIKATYNAISIACGGTQNRSVEVNHFEFGYAHTAYDNVTHGEVGGSFFKFQYGQITNHARWLNATTAFGGDLMMRDVFGEFNGRFGVVGGANNGNEITISGNQSKWDPNVFVSPVKFLEGNTPITFENHSFRMNDQKLFVFDNAKSTKFNDCKFTSDAGLPVIVGDQLNPQRLRLTNCERFNNASDYREDLNDTYIIPKASAGTYIQLEPWHKRVIQEGYGEIATEHTVKRSRANIYQITSLSAKHSWTSGVDTITVPSGYDDIATIGDLFSMQSFEGDSVIMGEITDIDYGANTIEVTPLWHNHSYEATPGTAYLYSRHYFSIDTLTGSITAGTNSVTVPDDSFYEVNQLVFFPKDNVVRRITAKPGSNVLTLHSTVPSEHIDADIRDATV